MYVFMLQFIYVLVQKLPNVAGYMHSTDFQGQSILENNSHDIMISLSTIFTHYRNPLCTNTAGSTIVTFNCNAAIH